MSYLFVVSLNDIPSPVSSLFVCFQIFLRDRLMRMKNGPCALILVVALTQYTKLEHERETMVKEVPSGVFLPFD
jgi:hypothetical protein